MLYELFTVTWSALSLIASVPIYLELEEHGGTLYRYQEQSYPLLAGNQPSGKQK